MSQAAGELSEALQLLHLRDLRQGFFPLSRACFDPPFQVGVCGGQLGSASFDPSLQLRVQDLELARLPEEVAEDADLRAKKSRNNGDRQIVDGACLVPSQAVEFGQVNRGNEDERSLGEPRMVADHRRQLKPVELRHRDVHKNDRNFVTQEQLKRLAARRRLDQILAQLFKDHFVAKKLCRLIVDD